MKRAETITMNESIPFISYTELTVHTHVMVDKLIEFASKETDIQNIASHLTQCTALLSMWGYLVSSFGFESQIKDHEHLASKIVAASEMLNK